MMYKEIVFAVDGYMLNMYRTGPINADKIENEIDELIKFWERVYTQQQEITMDHKKYITEKGTIHYWVNICTPEKKWIVFLPGLTADHSLFDSQVECFSKKYNMFV